MDEHNLLRNVAAQVMRNAAIVRNITSYGGDIQRDRTIDCFFHTRTEDNAITLSRLLQSQGFCELSITHTDGESEHPWTVQGELVSSVSNFTALDRVEDFVRLALDHDALFDGWGTLLDELLPTI